jgi:LuxR family transcriptional regulator, maltose regulon positive regulatory protein
VNPLPAPIARPLPDETPVPWPRLVERLQRGLGHRLILISAPPRSGKTLLAGSWTRACGLPVAWLSLTPGDAALDAFLLRLADALRMIFPAALEQTCAALAAAEPPPAPVLRATVLNDLDGLPASCVLVLDDYDAGRSPALDELWAAILRHPPRPLHLVLCTRQDPDLPLADLRARGNITEIRDLDLRLTAGEVAAYLRRRAGLTVTDELCDRVAKETEGWLAAVNLAERGLAPSTERAPADLPGALSEALWGADGQQQLDALFDGVLQRQPIIVQDFLTQTALLDRLHGPLCEAVTGLNGPECDGQRCLAGLERSNAFTVPLDDDHRWFCYHRLFREFLQRRLNATHSPAAIACLHARGGDWYAGQGYVAAAIPHLLAARSELAAVRLIDSRRHDVMEREDWPELELWLELLRPLIDAHPELLVLEAWTLCHHGRLAEAAACLERAEAQQPGQAAQAPSGHAGRAALTGEIATLRAELLCWAGDGWAALAAAERGLALTPRESSGLRGSGWACAAVARVLLGDRGDAAAILDEAQREDHVSHSTYAAHLRMVHCSIHWMAGDLPALHQTAGQMLRLATASRLNESRAWAYYFEGCAYYQQNDLPAAQQCFAATLAQLESAHGFAYAQAACGLAAVHHAEGHDDRALAVVAALLSRARETGDASPTTEAQAYRAYLAFAMGDKADAEGWARQSETHLNPISPAAFHAPQITLVRILADMHTAGSLQRAESALAALHDALSATHSTRFLSEVLALQALVDDAQGDARAAAGSLNAALALARPGGLIRVFVDLGPGMARLIDRVASLEPAGSFCTQILEAFRAPAAEGKPADQAGLIEPLSERELEVLALLGQRLSNKEIGRELGISAQTVKRHTMNIYQKLQVQSRREAVAQGAALGIRDAGHRPVPPATGARRPPPD